MKSPYNDLKTLGWLLSSKFERGLQKTLTTGFRGEFLELVAYSQAHSPTFRKYRPRTYRKLKRAAQRLLGLAIKELPLPQHLLGAFFPGNHQQRDTIVINAKRSPFFFLPTLAHEISHRVIHDFYGRKDQRTLNHETAYFRSHRIEEVINDKEEVLADSLTVLGALPSSMIKELYAPRLKPRKKAKLGLLSFLKHVWRDRKRFPEVFKGIFLGREWLFNLAVQVYFIRLRIFLFNRYAV